MVSHMLVIGLPVHCHLKILPVCGGATLFPLITYQFSVRYTLIGDALNEPRTPRWLSPSAAAGRSHGGSPCPKSTPSSAP